MSTPINDPNGPAYDVRHADGQKQVYSDHGSRVDIYENGQDGPDGPGHDHYWATFNRQGEMTGSGGLLNSDR
jgi:hypothetical protein